MRKVPNYPCHLFHKARPECQLVKSAEDHKKLHGWQEWVMEDETSYYKKPDAAKEVEEPVEELQPIEPLKQKVKGKLKQ